jgi:hypothetical protein
MAYKFNLKLQAISGILAFGVTLLVLYLILGKVDWITAGITGVINFLISGYYVSNKKCR